MTIRTRVCMSLDGYVTTADGWPVQLADPTFVPGQSHGFPEFQESCEAVLMGRTTFEPALGADRWPWPNLDAFGRDRLRLRLNALSLAEDLPQHPVQLVQRAFAVAHVRRAVHDRERAGVQFREALHRLVGTRRVGDIVGEHARLVLA